MINELLLAQLAHDVYSDPESFGNNSFGPWWDADAVIPFQNGGTEAALCIGDNYCIVSFRGTEPSQIADVLVDARFLWPRNYKGVGRVSRGFRDAYDKVSRNLMREVVGVHKKSIYITGHSLGGAIATIFAADLLTSRFSIGRRIRLCTMGSPAVGTRMFAKNMNATLGKRSVRYVNGPDPVPRLPPSDIMFLPRYRHVGRWQYFSGKDHKLIEDAEQDTRQADTLMSLWESCSLNVGVYHKASEYVKHIASDVHRRQRNHVKTLINESV